MTSDEAAPCTRVSLLWHRAQSHHHHMPLTWTPNVFTDCNTTFLLRIILHRNCDLTSFFLQPPKSGVDQSSHCLSQASEQRKATKFSLPSSGKKSNFGSIDGLVVPPLLPLLPNLHSRAFCPPYLSSVATIINMSLLLLLAL